jgi:hypothetical protein
MTLNPGTLPARAKSEAELYQWVRRDEEYATLGANVVVELYSESRARKPTTRAWAIIRPASAPAGPTAATPTEPTGQPSPGAGDSSRCSLTFTCHPSDSEQRFRSCCLA